MAKAIKYFAEYAAENGELGRVEIWVEGYVGAATEVICGGEPLLITRNKDVAETYLGGIVPTFYTFEFVSSSTFSASTFSSESYGDVIIRHLRAGVLEFNAIVTPFVTADDDLPATYYTFTLQGECGIKYLANQKIDATLGNVRLIDILAEAMALIPRVDNFPFKVVDNTNIYTAAGPIADNAPLFDRLINKRTFAGLTYLQVIEQIIANRCEVVLDAGAWWVRNIAELSEQYTQPTRTTNLVNYSATGVKGSTVAYRPELTRRRTKGGAFGALFSQKNIKITRQEPEKINFLPNNDFKGPVTSFVPSGWTLGPTSFSYTVDSTNGSFQFADSVFSPLFTAADGAYLQSSAVEWRPLFTLNLANQTPETLTIRVRAELDTGISFIRMQILATISDSVQYLTSEGSWTSSPSIYTQRADAVGRTGEFEINVPAPPLPGSITTGNFDQSIVFNLRVRLFRGERAIQGPGGLEQPGFVRFREVSVFKDALLGDSFEELNSTFDFRGDPNADRGDVEEIETLIASRNGFPYRHGSLFTAAGAEIVGFESPFGLGITGANYANYLAQSFLSVSGGRLRTYEGTYFDTFNWSDILVIDNRAYRLHNFQDARKTRLIRVKLVELTFNSLLTTSIDVINNEVDRIVRNIVQIGAIPQDFNFVSGSSYDGRTVFGIRPDTRFDSTNVAELLLRSNATAEDAGVSIKPGEEDINLLTPAPLVVGVTETIATREWSVSVLGILTDKTTNGPIDGIREVRSIDYYQGRMDFGFDKTLDVPYLFYDTGERILANYMDNDGVWFHVDQTGNQRRYLRQGDSVAPVPSLQAVTDVSRNSSNRILFNNVPYALTTDIPNLQAVSAAGASSSIRLQLNGVGYATLAEIGGGGGSVGSLSAVLGVGNNTNGIDINLNGLGVIRTGNVDGTPTVTIGNNANVDINSFNTIRVQSTNIRLNGGDIRADQANYFSVTSSDTAIVANSASGLNRLVINDTQTYLGSTGELSLLGNSIIFNSSSLIMDTVSTRMNDVLEVVASGIGNIKIKFIPGSLVNGQAYNFVYNSPTQTLTMTPA